jgi:hypothetical protein
MKTIYTLSLLPIIVLAYFFSAQLYVAANYLPAYALLTFCIFSIVFCIYNAGSVLERLRA